MRKLTTIASLLSAVTPRAAHADFWINWPNGQYTYVSDGDCFFWLCVAVVFVIVCAVLDSSCKPKSTSSSTLSATDVARQYEDDTSRYRALSRKLDAETDLAESVIKAKRTRAELDDIEEFFRDDNHRPRR